MSPVRVLFCGAKDVACECLKELCSRRSQLNIEVIGVVPGIARNADLVREHDIRSLARSLGISLLDDPPTAHGSCDILISVQYHRLFTASELLSASRYSVNLHMAPLPEYRGANQFSFAIINGDQEFGTTLHLMEPSKADSGPIIAQKRFPIAPRWTVKELRDFTVEQSIHLFKQTLPELISGSVKTTNQEDILPGKPRHFYRKRDIAEVKRLDPAWPLEKIDRYVRALDMPGFERPYFEYNGERIYLTKSSL